MQLNMSATTNHTTNSSTNSTGEDNSVGMSSAALGIIYTAYVGAIVLTITGNLISVVVLTKGRRCNTGIRTFLINLAVADLLMGILCIPLTFTYAINGRWIFPAWMCPVVQFTQMLVVTVSVYMNTAISIDRFLAIKYPLKLLRHTWLASRRTIIAIWLVSIALSSVQLVVCRTSKDSLGVQCREKWPDDYIKRWYTVAVLIITYLIPVLFIIIMYTMVCMQLWHRSAPGVSDQVRDTRQLATKRKVN